MPNFINIGFGNIVNTDQMIAVVNPDSAPAKRMVQHARESEHVIDATQGRKTKSVIVTQSEYIVLSALSPETLYGRCRGKETPKEQLEEEQQQNA